MPSSLKDGQRTELDHQYVIDQLTLEEKAALTSGGSFWETKAIDRVGIPSIFLSDGPHGLRKQTAGADHFGLNGSVPATSFPTAATLANSWDQELLYEVGRCLALEASEEEVSGLLGPGLNLKRNPRGGRNFEYFSEDPYLAGKLAAAFIRGVQSEGVAACPKHFAVNSQETYRMSINEVVDERALHEIYLEGFRIAIAEGDPWLLMTAYNKVNGTYAHENSHLVNDILRDRWGYDGAVVSDWGGNNDGAAALEAGSNLEMPSSNGITVARVLEAVKSGELDESVLDQRIDEFLTLLDRIANAAHREGAVDFDLQHRTAQRAAAESLVLLRNAARDSAGDADEANLPTMTLPLPKGEKVAVIGVFADDPRYQGAGSSLVNPTRLDSPLEALRHTDLDIVGYAPGFKRQDRPSHRLAKRALDLAAQADTVLLFLGLDEGAECEGVDRAHLRLARNQLSLTRDLLASGARVVVVLAGGAPVELPFADQVDAILHTYLAGQAGGRAIAEVLTGHANPGGKLAESYPLSYKDVPRGADYTAHEATAEHRESIYLGYRYYDKIGAPVRYPFGFGLSYTSFEYADAEVTVGGGGRGSETVGDSAGDREGEGEEVPSAVEVTVTNTGQRRGAEVVQIYVEAEEAHTQIRALRELRGFAKVDLGPGQSERVSIPLSDHSFSAFDVESDQWAVVPGHYRVLVAASSRDIRQTVSVEIADHLGHLPSALVGAADAPYVTGRVDEVDDGQFADLLGYSAPPRDWDRDAPLTSNSIVAQLTGHSRTASAVYGAITGAASLMDKVGQPTMGNYARFLLAMPLHSLSRMTSGLISESRQDNIITWLNGEGSPWRRGKK